MRNLTIKTQLICMIGVFALMMLGTGLLGLMGMKESNRSLKLVYEGNVTTMDKRLALKVQAPNYAQYKDAMTNLLKKESESAQKRYAEALARYKSIRNIMVVSILVTLLGGSLAVFIIIRTIRRSARTLADVSLRVVDGDLSVRVVCEKGDELGAIGESFNIMLDAFSMVYGKLKGNMALLASTAGHMNYSRRDCCRIEKIADKICSVATASEEMAATSIEIAHNCLTVAESSKHASTAALNGSAVVHESLSIMHRIADRVKETARTIDGLGARSDQIGDIVGTIEDIADQTNLLALNAAIEAARAGEQGRGFAVVADEVRALAERTAKATREIGGMIRSIQEETKNVVASMEEGVHEVERGTAEAERSGIALQEILDQINSVSIRVSEIATAAEEQTATISEISNNILQISEVVRDSSTGNQDSVSDSSQLSGIVVELERLVDNYKLTSDEMDEQIALQQAA